MKDYIWKKTLKRSSKNSHLKSNVKSQDTQKERVFFILFSIYSLKDFCLKHARQNSKVQELIILFLLSNMHSHSVPELCHSYCFLLAKSRSAWILPVSLRTGCMVHKNVHLTVTSFIMIQWQSKATKLVSTTWNREQTSYQSACLWKLKKKLNGCSLQMTKTKAHALEDLCYSTEDREPLAKFCRNMCYCLTC